MTAHLNLFTTADWYQHFIPLFCYCWKKAWPQYRIDVAVMGKVDDLTRNAMNFLDGVQIRGPGECEAQEGIIVTENILADIPQNPSTANTARFLFYKDTPYSIEGLFITDIDFLFFDCGEDIIEWHVRKAKEFGSCYYAHHGPWKKPARFPGAWHGEFERLAGGAVYLSKEWLETCRDSLDMYRKQLEAGKIGTYREEDEVIFCRICKESGLPINQDKNYPAKYRGIHLGDFRPDMQHRWTDMEKMRGKLIDENCMRYLQMRETDMVWNSLCDTVCLSDERINQVFANLHEHLRIRGMIR